MNKTVFRFLINRMLGKENNRSSFKCSFLKIPACLCRSYRRPSLPFLSAVIVSQKKCVYTLDDLPDGTLEPLARRDDPQAERVHDDDGDSDGCIVECLRVDGVELGETKHDRDERDPEHGCASYYEREPTEMEWSAHETVRIEYA